MGGVGLRQTGDEVLRTHEEHFVALTLLLVGCTSAGPPGLLTTYGTAVLRVPPEIFQLNLEVSSLDSDPARALTENERKLGQLRKLLEEFHVQAQDFVIEDSSVGLADAAEKKVRRYQARRSISVILYDLKQREDLSLRLVQQHLGDVSSRTHDVKDPPSLRNCARLEALKLAWAKAQAMAKELGQSLGKAFNVEEEKEDWGLQGSSNVATVIPGPDSSGTFLGAGLVEVEARVKVSFILNP